MDWTQVEERIVEDDRNKWDRKTAAEELRIAPRTMWSLSNAFTTTFKELDRTPNSRRRQNSEIFSQP